MKEYDLVIIGAGPGGYEAAFDAAEYGIKTALIEKEEVGGTCLNHGCIPTKTLMHSADLYREMKESALFGVNAEKTDFDMKAVQARKKEVLSQLRDGIRMLAKKKKIDLYEGVGTIQDPNTVKVGEEELSTKYILIATGSYAFVPPIKGADLPGVVTSDDLLEKEELFKHLVIIGGGVIGMEFASIYSALGAEVTVIEALPRIIANMDKEFSQSLKMSLKKRGVDIHTGALVKEIRPGEAGLEVVYTEKDADATAAADGVLVCVGRRAYTDGLLGEGVELKMDRGRIVVNSYGRTNIHNIYACGDVIGGVMLAHAATAEGRNAVENIQHRLHPGSTVDLNMGEDYIDVSTVPGCIYTSPEIASVGLTLDQAREAGMNADSHKYVMSANGKTVLSNGDRGFMKVVYDKKTGRIIGAQMMCERATDMIGEFATAIVNELTLADLAKVIRPHPTFEEAVTETVRF